MAPVLTLPDTQVPATFRSIFDEQAELYNRHRSITVLNAIPDTSRIPIENRLHWLRIPDVVCVFVDMKGSTKFSASHHDNGTAGAYQLFTETAIRVFDEVEAPYIDVRGDGVFALFDRGHEYRALAAAITFKTFAQEVFAVKVKETTGLDVSVHIGIDQKTLLVRKFGLKRRLLRSDRQNEVWAGKPVNMASKLAAIGDAGQLHASDRFYARVTDDRVRLSCGCPNGTKGALWTEVDVADNEQFDFDRAYLLTSNWCRTHGREFCDAVLGLDEA